MARLLRPLALAAASAAALAGAENTTKVSPPIDEDPWQVDSQASCDGKQTTYTTCQQIECQAACTPVNCSFAEWQTWSAGDCTGLCERQRSVANHNNECGNPCTGPMIETKRCATTCHKPAIDCAFGEWTEWTGVQSSLPCSGEERQKIRTREITTPEELHGGEACDGVQKQTEGCPAPVPQDCVLSEWSKWDECSVTCGDGQTTRMKTIEKMAMHGGIPCTGDLKETKECSADPSSLDKCPSSVDCLWAQWNDWGACTCSCGGGQTTRDRVIQESPKGAGKLCDPKDRTVIAPCKTQSCDVANCIDGAWGQWSAYGPCSAKCGGGVQWRSRQITAEANACGEPAMGLDKEVKPCNSDSCAPDVDCQFSQWEEWGDCSCTADGVKRRVRQISKYGEGEGAWCSGDLKQVQPCNTCEDSGTCDKVLPPVDCQFSPFAPATGAEGQCSVTCGKGQQQVMRSVLVEAANGGTPCNGTLHTVEICAMPVCPEGPEPAGCEWGDWMPWGACDKCGGQKKRNRQILQMPAAGGEPCQPGSSEETVKCPRECHEPAFCEWSAWEEQGACSTECGAGFISKSRVLKPTSNTTSRRLASIDWDNITIATPADCEGRQMQRFECNLKKCAVSCTPVNCMFDEWSKWSSGDCTGLCERHRGVLTPNNECGVPCNDSLIETERCKTPCHKTPVDCVISEWSVWYGQSDQNDAPCALGSGDTQKVRSRDIKAHAVHGGASCVGDLKELAECAKPAVKDCIMSQWSEYSPCSVECGPGQKTRTRDVTQEATPTGQYCDGDLVDTAPCEEKPCEASVDCLWEQWAQWSACTCSCGGGQRTRDRVIKHSPKGDGRLCEPKDRTEIAPCSTQSCTETNCIDGKWGEWNAFGLCSAKCGGGLTWRYRKIVTEASACGVPAVGLDKDVKPCNTQSCAKDVDCELAQWSDWGDCSCTEDGVKRRVRDVLTYGSGDGKWCNGDLKEVSPCNTCTETNTCNLPDPKVNCSIGKWHTAPAALYGGVGICSATCGGGQKEEVRDIEQEAKNGGEQCNGNLHRVVPCNEDVPCPTKAPPKGCVWNSWMQWGACDKCGGQRKRNRQILRMPEPGGEPCELGASEEIEKCDRHCHDRFFCEWGAWEKEGECSVSCGTGTIKKARYLKPTVIPPTNYSALAQIYSDSEEAAPRDAGRLRDIVVAFTAGSFISFTLFVVMHRAFRSERHAINSLYSRDLQHVPVDE